MIYYDIMLLLELVVGSVDARELTHVTLRVRDLGQLRTRSAVECSYKIIKQYANVILNVKDKRQISTVTMFRY